MEIYQKIKCREQLRATFLTLTIISIILFMSSFISAFDWTNSLISYYPMDNNSDVVGNNALFPQNGQITFSSGIIGNAGVFDGTNTSSMWIGNSTGNPSWNWTSSTTLNFWIKENKKGTYFTRTSGAYIYTSTGNQFNDANFGTNSIFASNIPPAGTGKWIMITLRRNATDTSLWINGTQASSGTNNAGWNYFVNVSLGNGSIISEPNANASIDEIGLWNRSLTGAEISNLYNDGSGITYSSQRVNLNYPSNNTNVISPVTLNCTAISSSPIVNVSLYLNGNLNYTITGTGNTTELDKIFTLGLGSYNWSCSAWDNSLLQINSSINTFNVTTWMENNVTYNSTTIETASETFVLNISQQNPNAVTAANFWYNGTDRGEAIVNKIGGNTIITSTMDIPFGITSANFYWSIITGGLDVNSTVHTQTINPMIMGACNATLQSLALNFTTYSEMDLTRLTPYNFYGTFFYWIGNGNYQKNFSISNQGINEQDICINTNQTYQANAIMQYEKNPGYVKRSYYFTNENIMNNSRNVSFYLLNTTSSTSFIINVKDVNQLSISNAFISIQRYYPGTNTLNTVEMGVTDNQGSTVGHFETETEDYRIVIEKNNNIIYTGPTSKIYCSSTPCTLNIQTSGGNSSLWKNFGDVTNFTYSLSYDNSSNTWTMTYADTSGHIGYGRFFVYYDDPLKGAVTICNISSTNMSDILPCPLGGYNGTIYGAVYLSRSPEVLVYLSSVFTFGPKAIFGNEGLFLSLLVLLTLGLAGLWNPVVGVVLVVVGMITLTLTGIASFGAVTLWGVIFIAGLIIWELNN
jgi:hypothetical protein